MFDQIRATWLRRKAEKINFGRVTAAEFMHNLGATDAQVKQWASAFGGKLREAHEAKHGVKPPKAGAAVVKMGKKSRLIAVYAYRWDELEFLIGVALSYKPVAALIEF